jgi:hypothetical protein
VKDPSGEDYRRLLAFRTGLRRFLKWSEEQARAAGLTPKHHQLLLAIRGHDILGAPPSRRPPGTCCSATTARSSW